VGPADPHLDDDSNSARPAPLSSSRRRFTRSCSALPAMEVRVKRRRDDESGAGRAEFESSSRWGVQQAESGLQGLEALAALLPLNTLTVSLSGLSTIGKTFVKHYLQRWSTSPRATRSAC
jgi:hypothetical protein